MNTFISSALRWSRDGKPGFCEISAGLLLGIFGVGLNNFGNGEEKQRGMVTVELRIG